MEDGVPAGWIDRQLRCLAFGVCRPASLVSDRCLRQLTPDWADSSCSSVCRPALPASDRMSDIAVERRNTAENEIEQLEQELRSIEERIDSTDDEALD